MLDCAGKSGNFWNAMSKRKNKPRTVELVISSYQPTKAEKEEEISLDNAGETITARMSEADCGQTWKSGL